MNRLLPAFFLLFLLSSAHVYAQPGTGYLFIKKGIKKKRIFTEGDAITVRLQNDLVVRGYITLLRNDSIWLNGTGMHKTFVKEVLLGRKKGPPFPDAKTLALIAAGAALTSAGLALNNHDNRDEALLAGPVIGFGPLLLKHFGGKAIRAIPRKKFRMGRKFYLQVLDFHYIPNQRRRSF